MRWFVFADIFDPPNCKLSVISPSLFSKCVVVQREFSR